MNGLTFRELVYEGSNILQLIKRYTLNKVGLRGTIQGEIVVLQAE